MEIKEMEPQYIKSLGNWKTDTQYECYLAKMPIKTVNSRVPKTVRHGTSLHRICPKLLIDSSPSRLESIDSSPRRLSVDRRQKYLARVLFDLSPRRLSVDRRWNDSAQVLVDSSPQRLSVDRRGNYLARVPGVCHSTDVETVDSNPNCLSLVYHNH